MQIENFRDYINNEKMPNQVKTIPVTTGDPLSHLGQEINFAEAVALLPVVNKDRVEEDLQTLSSAYRDLGLENRDARVMVESFAHNFYNGNIEGQAKTAEQVSTNIADLYRRKQDARRHPYYRKDVIIGD